MHHVILPDLNLAEGRHFAPGSLAHGRPLLFRQFDKLACKRKGFPLTLNIHGWRLFTEEDVAEIKAEAEKVWMESD
jgi:hypothetical protein